MQVQILSRRPISAASNKSNSPVSPTGDRSATLRAAANFGRLMVDELCQQLADERAVRKSLVFLSVTSVIEGKRGSSDQGK